MGSNKSRILSYFLEINSWSSREMWSGADTTRVATLHAEEALPDHWGRETQNFATCHFLIKIKTKIKKIYLWMGCALSTIHKDSLFWAENMSGYFPVLWELRKWSSQRPFWLKLCSQKEKKVECNDAGCFRPSWLQAVPTEVLARVGVVSSFKSI